MIAVKAVLIHNVGVVDATVVVLVPEAGDEVQTMKAGLMEIGNVFVVNKADRPDADLFVRNLHLMLMPTTKEERNETEVIKTIATEKKGSEDVWKAIEKYLLSERYNVRKDWLLAEKAYQLIQKKRMRDIDKNALKQSISEKNKGGSFNLYQFVAQF